MKLWEVLLKWFGDPRNSSITTHRLRPEFCGPPDGDGLWLMREELARACADVENVRTGWLTKIRYAGEDRISIAVILDASGSYHETASEFAAAYQGRGLPTIDILFLRELPAMQLTVLEDLEPFYPI